MITPRTHALGEFNSPAIPLLKFYVKKRKIYTRTSNFLFTKIRIYPYVGFEISHQILYLNAEGQFSCGIL